jgi:hypothetical protein
MVWLADGHKPDFAKTERLLDFQCWPQVPEVHRVEHPAVDANHSMSNEQ